MIDSSEYIENVNDYFERLSTKTIQQDFKNNSGPTLVIGDFNKEFQDINNDEIGLDYKTILQLSMIEDKDEKGVFLYSMVNLLYIFQEYVHYGD
jgi:hypothetical protein